MSNASLSVFRVAPQDFSPAVDVAACYIESNGELLLLKRAESESEGGRWGVPGGKVEKGESVRDGAMREVWEETGMRLKDKELQYLGKLFIRKPHVEYVYHMFYCKFARRPVVVLNHEHQEYRWLSAEKAATLPVMLAGQEALRYFQELVTVSDAYRGQFTFFPVEQRHLPVIHDWFTRDHVKEFYYGEGLERTLKNLGLFVQGICHNGEYSFEHWIAYLQDVPFGFLMTSRVDGPQDPADPVEKWFEEGKETITLDLLIGPEEYIGKGLGPRMIREFLADKFSHVTKVLIDPEVSNVKAIRAYEKAGFKKVEQFLPKYSINPSWMMVRPLA